MLHCREQLKPNCTMIVWVLNDILTRSKKEISLNGDDNLERVRT
jgi:hypothetical protein